MLNSKQGDQADPGKVSVIALRSGLQHFFQKRPGPRVLRCAEEILRRTGFDGYLTAEVFREDSAVPEIPYEKFYSAVAKAMVRILEENEKEQ